MGGDRRRDRLGRRRRRGRNPARRRLTLPQRRALIHCGLHKTGSTAIQLALATSRDALRAAGITYPDSATGDGAHHNVAWELAGDRRWRSDRFGLADALDAADRAPGDLVLSSEDFETVLARPAGLRPLTDGLRARGFDVTLLAYVRERTAYAEALFVELLKHGLRCPFAEFVRAVRRTGRFTLDDWVFLFDAAPLEAAVTALDGVAGRTRAYESACRDRSIIPDFAGVLDVDPALFGANVDRRVHQRPDGAATLALFVGRRARRLATPDEVALVARWLDRAGITRLAAGPRWRLDATTPDRANTGRLKRVCSRPSATAVRLAAATGRADGRLATALGRVLGAWWRSGAGW